MPPSAPAVSALERELKFLVPATRSASPPGVAARVCVPERAYPPALVCTTYFDTPGLSLLGEKIDSDYLKTKVRRPLVRVARGQSGRQPRLRRGKVSRRRAPRQGSRQDSTPIPTRSARLPCTRRSGGRCWNVCGLTRRWCRRGSIRYCRSAMRYRYLDWPAAAATDGGRATSRDGAEPDAIDWTRPGTAADRRPRIQRRPGRSSAPSGTGHPVRRAPRLVFEVPGLLSARDRPAALGPLGRHATTAQRSPGRRRGQQHAGDRACVPFIFLMAVSLAGALLAVAALRAVLLVASDGQPGAPRVPAARPVDHGDLRLHPVLAAALARPARRVVDRAVPHADQGTRGDWLHHARDRHVDRDGDVQAAVRRASSSPWPSSRCWCRSSGRWFGTEQAGRHAS